MLGSFSQAVYFCYLILPLLSVVHAQTRPTCSELGNARTVAVYNSTTAGMTMKEVTGISISNTTGSVAVTEPDANKIHIMDAELNAMSSIFQQTPFGTTYDDNGLLYVTIRDGHKVNVYDSTQNHISSFGSYGTGYGQFNKPKGITHKAGVLYVCDSGNKRVQVFHTNGSFIAAFGKSDFLSEPLYIAVDTNIFVSDGSGALYIFNSAYTRINKFNSGEFPLFSQVKGIVLYNGCLIVADLNSDSIKVFNGDNSLAATIGSNGNSVGQLNNPYGIAVTPLGAIYVADSGNKRVQLFQVP